METIYDITIVLIFAACLWLLFVGLKSETYDR